MRKAITQYRKTIATFSTLSSEEVDAIHRATTDFWPDTYDADLEEAQSVGLDAALVIECDHDSVVRRARKAANSVTLEEASLAFVAGLSPESVVWRGVLKAFAVCCQLPSHKADLDEDAYDPPCRICGHPAVFEWSPVGDGLLLASEGLLRGLNETVSLTGAAMCLEWFRSVTPPVVKASDWHRVTSLFEAIAQVPAKTTGPQLAKLLKASIPGDDTGRESLVETLGLCGLLVNPPAIGDLQGWTKWQDRPFGSGRNAEMLPPSCAWRREHGVDAELFAAIFPKARIPKSLAVPRKK